MLEIPANGSSKIHTVEAYSGHTDYALFGEEGRAMKRYCVSDNTEDQDAEVRELSSYL